MNTIQGKEKKAARASTLAAGARKRFPNGSQVLTFEGGSPTLTVDATVAELQQLVDLRAAVTGAQATARVKVEAERAQAPALVAFMNAFEALVRFTFGNDAVALADFGLLPRKGRTPLTAEQKAVAAARNAATRKARGTKGSRQKAGIHGNITATLVVTPAAPPAGPTPAAASATTPPK